MSLYREPGRVAGRTLALVAVAALVVGLAGGFAIGRASKSEPSLASQMADLRGKLGPAREGLEIVPTEYSQGAQGAGAEGAAAKSAVERAQSAIKANHDDIEALSAARAKALDAAMTELSSAIDQSRPPAEVKRLDAAAIAALQAVLGR